MNQTAKYICPVRGLVDLSAPDPEALGRAARIASSLGLTSLLVPVLEESLTRSPRQSMEFLDRFILALDAAGEGGVGVILNPLAQLVLDLDWTAKEMVRPPSWEGRKQVFVQGKVRYLQPLDWWTDPALISRRIRTLREFVSATAGHPAIAGWSVLDRALDWVRPEPGAAELVLRSFVAEIRTRDEQTGISLDLGWPELARPDLVAALCPEVDLLRVDTLGFEKEARQAPQGLSGEMLAAAFLRTMTLWLWEKPAEPVVGRLFGEVVPDDETFEAARVLAGQTGPLDGPAGLCWFNLIDPSPERALEPPWVLFPRHHRTGLLDRGGEPKEAAEPLVKALNSGAGSLIKDDFIDLSRDEYRNDPATHLSRLWDHFREYF